MKILMATPTPPYTQPTNSVPLVTHCQLVGLVDRHEVTLVTGAGHDPTDQAAVAELQKMGIELHVAWRPTVDGVRRWQRRGRLVKFWLGGRYPFRTVWYWQAEVQRVLDRLLAERHFDLVTAADNAMGIYHYRTARPTLLTEMEVRRPRAINWTGWSSTPWRQWAFGEVDWQRWQGYQRQVWQRFDCVQVFTARDAAAIGRIAPTLAKRVRVNPFGIDLPAPADPQREDESMVLFVGGFSHWPNVDAALWLAQAIMPLLRLRRPGIRLFLVGSYPPAAVQALADDDIIVTGGVPAVEPFLERAAVVVAPVRVGGGMRMKVLQAMAVGKAVVSTPLGAEGLTLGCDQPPLMLASEAEAMAQAITRLLAEADQRHALGRAARAFVADHFSAQAYAGRLETIYRDLLDTQLDRR